MIRSQIPNPTPSNLTIGPLQQVPHKRRGAAVAAGAVRVPEPTRAAGRVADGEAEEERGQHPEGVMINLIIQIKLSINL